MPYAMITRKHSNGRQKLTFTAGWEKMVPKSMMLP